MSDTGYVICAYLVASVAILYMSLGSVVRMSKIQRKLDAQKRGNEALDDAKE
jgi:hypothetical protein